MACRTILLSCLYCCRRLHLEAVSKRVLPEHTHDALFQLFCDLRTNTPKDRVFFTRHAKALQPHTMSGWLVCAACNKWLNPALTKPLVVKVKASPVFKKKLFDPVGHVCSSAILNSRPGPDISWPAWCHGCHSLYQHLLRCHWRYVPPMSVHTSNEKPILQLPNISWC